MFFLKLRQVRNEGREGVVTVSLGVEGNLTILG